jgi:hypothetical protein
VTLLTTASGVGLSFYGDVLFSVYLRENDRRLVYKARLCAPLKIVVKSM